MGSTPFNLARSHLLFLDTFGSLVHIERGSVGSPSVNSAVLSVNVKGKFTNISLHGKCRPGRPLTVLKNVKKFHFIPQLWSLC